MRPIVTACPLGRSFVPITGTGRLSFVISYAYPCITVRLPSMAGVMDERRLSCKTMMLLIPSAQ